VAVADKVKSIIVEQLGVDEEEVTPDASFVDDLGADSLDTVELVMAFEEEFGIEIPDEDAEKITRVKEAVEYIESHLSEPLTMEDIAAHVDMSIRSVRQGFRQEMDVSPMSYVRDRRLDHARAELSDAIPSDGVSVTDVAMKWGFTHLSNFSALYRRRFGELPSQTLRR